MDLLIYRDINEFYTCFYNDSSFKTLLENIDSFKNGFMDSLSIPKCKKLFTILNQYKDCQVSEYVGNFPEIKGTPFDLISTLIQVYEMHPLLKLLITYFYMTHYTCYDHQDSKIFFELSLRKYMGFFMERGIVSLIFKWPRASLAPFVKDGLFVLNEAANFTRRDFINYFYEHHFRSRYLSKEYSETESVFALTDYKNKSTINICAGSACGIHFLDSKMTCLDLNKYTGMELLEKMNVCNFLQCNIMDTLFESVASLFNLWVAIHACRNLSIRILEIFEKHAPKRSELYLVPCCIVNKRYYKEKLDDSVFDRIYEKYYTAKHKKDGLRQHCYPALHMELLSSICTNRKFKIKTLTNMKCARNKVIIVHK